MNDRKIKKLNDRKIKLEHEYKKGNEYFIETSKENYINKDDLFVNSMYNSFLNVMNEEILDESIDNKNSPE